MALLKRILFLLLISSLISSVQGITDMGYNSVAWSSSNYDAARIASKAIDRNNTTFWAPLAFNGSIGIDLGKNYTIYQISIYSVAYTVIPLYVNGSYDNVSWTQIYYNSSFNLSETKDITINSNYRYLNISSLTSGQLLINEIYVYVDEPQLISPQDDESLSKDYPPLTEPILFEWSYDISGWSSNLIVAKDVNFNIIAVDTTTSNNYSTQALEAGDYWWKVAYYNATSGTLYGYSNVSNFTLTNIIGSISGTSAYGTVYKIVDGTRTPISGAEVRIWDNVSMTSQSMSTGSNGYYQFTGLVNSSTYYIQAKKADEYDDSAIEIVTTGLGTSTQKDIQMFGCTVAYNCYALRSNVKFIVADGLSVTKYSGVTISVYNDGDVLPSYTGTTGIDGSKSFPLTKTHYYRVTAVKASQGIDEEIYFTPQDENEEYTFTIYFAGENRDDSVSWGLTVPTYNDTSAMLNFTYNDTSSETTSITFFVKYWDNGTIIYTNTVAAATMSASYTVNSTSAMGFLWGFNATRGGEVFTSASGIKLPGSSGVLIDLKIDEKYYQWISVSLLMGITLLFSKTTRRYGYVLIPLMAVFLYFIKWLDVSWVLISSALVIGVIAYYRSAEKRSEVGY